MRNKIFEKNYKPLEAFENIGTGFILTITSLLLGLNIYSEYEKPFTPIVSDVLYIALIIFPIVLLVLYVLIKMLIFNDQINIRKKQRDILNDDWEEAIRINNMYDALKDEEVYKKNLVQYKKELKALNIKVK